MSTIKIFTSFSGYDSQLIALERLKKKYPDFDYECVGWSEIDSAAITAHNSMFPDLADKNYGDIAKIDWTSVPDFDIFTYSSPCTDFSIAGNMDGGEKGSGTRSSLLWECERAIKEKRPKYCILENVPALVSKAFMPLFRKWIKTVDSYGYESFWQTLNAKDFGIPHNRNRVFLVSIRKDDPTDVIQYNFPSTSKLEKNVEDFYEQGPIDKKYYVKQENVDKWCIENEERIIKCIKERNHSPENDVQYNKENDSKEHMAEKKTKKKAKKEEIESTPLIPDEFNADYEQPDAWTANTKKKSKKNKFAVEYLTDEEKELRKGMTCVKRIPTPTCSDGSAPTLMATGYANASYKNFYSVGHFPKLGVFEIWRKD